MEKEMLKDLKHIKRVPLPENIWPQIQKKIKGEKLIPIYQLRAAAAMLACIFVTEMYIAYSFNSSSSFSTQTEIIAPINYNTLYDEQY